MKLFEFLLNSESGHNGHKQTEIGEISFKNLRAVVDELDRIVMSCIEIEEEQG